MKLAKVFKSGGSCVAAVPPEIMQALDVKIGDQLVFVLKQDGTVMVAKARMDLFVAHVKREAANG
jgi:antitoxin component of MazEF toxin-antitoxin module